MTSFISCSSTSSFYGALTPQHFLVCHVVAPQPSRHASVTKHIATTARACHRGEAEQLPRITMLGVVVVGIGIAGSVRIRDLLNPLKSSPSENLKLAGFVSRRDLGQYNGVKQIPLEEVLASKEVDAAFICTDNQNHEESVRSFLATGKHVLVEYPMALSAKAAHELWNLADEKGKVLHVEHIELLTEEYRALKKEVDGKTLEKGILHFTGGPLDKLRSGFPAFSGIARVTWLVDLFGELTVSSATQEENPGEKYCKLTAHFLTANNKPLTWIEERAPGLKREKKVNFTFAEGVLDALPPSGKGSIGPFMEDQNLFAQKVVGQIPKEELAAEKKRILHCIDLADKIKQYCEH